MESKVVFRVVFPRKVLLFHGFEFIVIKMAAASVILGPLTSQNGISAIIKFLNLAFFRAVNG